MAISHTHILKGFENFNPFRSKYQYFIDNLYIRRINTKMKCMFCNRKTASDEHLLCESCYGVELIHLHTGSI